MQLVPGSQWYKAKRTESGQHYQQHPQALYASLTGGLCMYAYFGSSQASVQQFHRAGRHRVMVSMHVQPAYWYDVTCQRGEGFVCDGWRLIFK